jgi:hypothetical protein
MHQFDAQLLCTFSKFATYLVEIEALFKYYTIVDNRVYVLQNGQNREEIFLTFNALKTGGSFYTNTISVHRKKEYNVLYSINALNELIKRENGGIASPSYKVDWSKFQNSFITAREGVVKVTPTKLLKIHNKM